MDEKLTQDKVKQNGHSPLVADSFGDDLVLDDLTLEDLMSYGTEAGIDWSTLGHQNRIAQAREVARKHAPRQPPKWSGAIQSVIVWFGSITLLASMFIVANVVMPLSMLALPYAEKARVETGIRMFDPDNAGILSSIIVVFMLGLLFVQAHRGGNTQHTKSSLRLMRARFNYWMGRGDKWRKQTVTDDEMLSSAIAWNNRLIVFLGTVGALQDEIALHATGQSWLRGLWFVLGKSDLNTVFALIGGAVVTAALLFGMRFVVGYNYARFSEMITSADFLSVQSPDALAAEDEAARQYVMAQIVRHKIRQNRKT